MSSITILARSTTTPSRTSSLPRTVTEPSSSAPAPAGGPHHWWQRRHHDDTITEISPRVIDLQIRSVALWPRGYR